MAEDLDHVPLQLLVCARDDCRAVFYLCRHCYRGQRYCSRPCARLVRTEQLRLARRRYRRSPAGQATHRDYARGCRLRQAKARWDLKLSVVDQSSQKADSAPPYPHAKPSAATHSPDTVIPPSPPSSRSPFRTPFCVLCGRAGVVGVFLC